MDHLKAQVSRLNLADAVHFLGHVKARYGFSKGSLLVVPSRGDSMPYVVIEAAAAGIPMVAANVGGIPEIFGPDHHDALFAPNIVGAMADAVEGALDDLKGAQARAKSLRERIFLHFSQKAMVEGVLSGYRDAFAIYFTTVTVSSNLSRKPKRWQFRCGTRVLTCCPGTDVDKLEPINARSMLDAAATAALTASAADRRSSGAAACRRRR